MADTVDIRQVLSGLVPVERSGDWRSEAVCASAPNLQIFMPFSFRQWGWALLYCQVCPVAEECRMEEEAILSDYHTMFPYDNRLYDTTGVRAGRLGGVWEGEPRFSLDDRGRPSRALKLRFGGLLDECAIPSDDGEVKGWRIPCEWCGETYNARRVSNEAYLIEVGAFCSRRCRQEAKEFKVIGRDGKVWRACHICSVPCVETDMVNRRSSSSKPWIRQCKRCAEERRVYKNRLGKKAHRRRVLEKWGNRDGSLARPCTDCGKRFSTRSLYTRQCQDCHPKLRNRNRTKTCKHCGSEFLVGFDRKAQRRKMCSDECRWAARRKTPTEVRVCAAYGCARTFEVAANRPRRYCSVACGSVAQVPLKHMRTTCRVCGGDLAPYGHSRTHSKMFCSVGCAAVAKRKPRLCASCQDALPADHEAYGRSPTKAFFCDKPECQENSAINDANLAKPRRDNPDWRVTDQPCRHCHKMFTRGWNRWVIPDGPKFCSFQCLQDHRVDTAEYATPDCTVCGAKLKTRSMRHRRLHESGKSQCDCRCLGCVTARSANVEFICSRDGCDIRFQTPGYRKRRYCSVMCANTAVNGRRRALIIDVVCQYTECGVTFKAKASQGRKYCSRACSMNGQRISRLANTKSDT